MGKKLVFEKKKRLGIRKDSNKNTSVFVSISEKSKLSRFTIYNEWYKTISKTGYVVIAVSENRLYFKESNFKDGWVFSKTNRENAKYISIKNEKIYKWINDNGIGSYEFRYDEEIGLYYIEKMVFEKNNEE